MYFCIIITIIIAIMVKVRNPFVIGKYISAEFFCDRENETKQLIRNIENGRNVFFSAPRRMGKTGLIRHLFAQEEIQKDYYTFFIDLYGTKSLSELVYVFGKAVFETLKPKGLAISERLKDFLLAIRVGMKIDPNTGEPSLDMGLGTIQHADTTLDEIFAYLERADKPCVVAFDEFQQITEYDEKNVEAVLRTRIQHCSNTFFIYTGSKRHMIAQMFSSPAKPFYASSFGMGLKPIPLDSYTTFAIQKFHDFNKDILPAVVEHVYMEYEGCTWYVHCLLNELFSMTDENSTCDVDMIPEALDNILSGQHDNYSQMMDFISTKQKMVLQAIARDGIAHQITSAAFLRKHSIPSASMVQSAIKGLLEKDIVIRQDDDTYRIYDYFFSKWLARL